MEVKVYINSKSYLAELWKFNYNYSKGSAGVGDQVGGPAANNPSGTEFKNEFA